MFDDNDRDDEIEDFSFTEDEEPVALTFDAVMCSRGHIRTEENTLIRTTWYGYQIKRCRDCERERERTRTHTPSKPLDEARTDAYPMHFGEGYYRDEGCSYAPSCLNCPLTQCRYDSGSSGRRRLSLDREQQAVQLRNEGRTVDQISAALNVSRRSVFRILAAAVSV